MLSKLEGADFTRSNLIDCAFRKALLDGASFREARLERVSLEEARLLGADFTGAELVEMEWWGDPDYTGHFTEASGAGEHQDQEREAGRRNLSGL
jgi:hypothetical protein